MFCKCCENRTIETYSIIHEPKPIKLPQDMELTIKELLWYVPNISSFQASENELIGDSVYSDFSIKYLLDKMGMTEEQDVLWLNHSELIDEDTWKYYENSICINCQKIIIVKCESLSKPNNLLRCIRNCIAHGQFSIVGDYFIGFNEDKGRRKAIIKIKPQLLLSALKELDSPRTKEQLIGFALEKAGYTIMKQAPIIVSQKCRLFCDIIAKKDGKTFAIEIKSYSGQRYIGIQELELFTSSNPDLPKDTYRVLFIDTSRVRKEVRKQELNIDNLTIIDLKQIKQLFNGESLELLSCSIAV